MKSRESFVSPSQMFSSLPYLYIYGMQAIMCIFRTEKLRGHIKQLVPVSVFISETKTREGNCVSLFRFFCRQFSNHDLVASPNCLLEVAFCLNLFFSLRCMYTRDSRSRLLNSTTLSCFILLRRSYCRESLVLSGRLGKR